MNPIETLGEKVKQIPTYIKLILNIPFYIYLAYKHYYSPDYKWYYFITFILFIIIWVYIVYREFKKYRKSKTDNNDTH